jgi:hypothetical protein
MPSRCDRPGKYRHHERYRENPWSSCPEAGGPIMAVIAWVTRRGNPHGSMAGFAALAMTKRWAPLSGVSLPGQSPVGDTSNWTPRWSIAGRVVGRMRKETRERYISTPSMSLPCPRPSIPMRWLGPQGNRVNKPMAPWLPGLPPDNIDIYAPQAGIAGTRQDEVKGKGLTGGKRLSSCFP